MIRRFTRNGRDAALVAAVVQALEPRFEAIDRRFEAIENRLDGMDRRFEAIENRLDGMDRRFVSIDHRFEAIDNRFEAIDNRFDALDVKWEGRFVALSTEMSKLRVGYADVREHVARLHENVNARMDGFEARLNEMGEEFAAQFAALSQTVVHGFGKPDPS